MPKHNTRHSQVKLGATLHFNQVLLLETKKRAGGWHSDAAHPLMLKIIVVCMYSMHEDVFG